MREDDERFRRFVPLLRLMIILVAVLIAVPVILWTITAFVRAYVGPPKIPTFHQIAAIPTPGMSESTNSESGGRLQTAPEQAKLSNPSSATAEASATATDARDISTAANGPSLGDRLADADSNASASAPKMADMSPAAPAGQKSAAMPLLPVPPVFAPTKPDAAAANTGTLVAQQPTPGAAMEPPADTMPAAAPLTGPIPLPRHRPHVVAEAPMTQMAQMNASVPMPRPRPDAAGPAAPPETTSAGPLDFLQNIFREKGE